MRVPSQFDSSTTVADVMFTPLSKIGGNNPWHRKCQVISDQDWLRLGVYRVLEQEPSGRAFLQSMSEHGRGKISISSLFDNLASPRRLNSIRWSAHKLYQYVVRERLKFDPLSRFKCLHDFDIFSGDGHHHAKATHDLARLGHDLTTQHFYALDMRTHALRHITTAQSGPETTASGSSSIRKREHDMHAMKRIGPHFMRFGAPTGKKVIHVWDRASIDLSLWTQWKARHGIYFISRLKDHINLTKRGDFRFDSQDPINAGIVSNEFMSSSSGAPVRLITYECPATAERIQFITSEHNIPPGLIAYLYKMRWDIEKVFDEVKIKCRENKSWGSTPQAKEMQAQFICIAHNLMLLLEDKLFQEEEIVTDLLNIG